MVGLVLLVSKWIKAIDFAEKHGFSVAIIYTDKHNGKIPESAFSLNNDGHYLIDESFFSRRLDFRKRVWLEAHDNYYFLTKHSTLTDIAKILNRIDPSQSVNCWVAYMSSALFASLPTSITVFKTTELLYKFYRYTRWIIRGLFIKYGRYVSDRKKIVASVLDNY